LACPSAAPPREIEEAIINSGADALFFAFSRGYKPLSVQLLERHQGDFRPVLLDPATRRRYDEQCSLHRMLMMSAPFLMRCFSKQSSFHAEAAV
jgi:hypothetical protein